ncbi:MAG: Error-prone polymerase [Verrucomicrobiales bacterium]|jgi:predicted metal-dependent phosphoesterase TrpH|nr:Error-prone polymerase [Verrucomicrobiales bacterium]MDB6131116.1 Error-prone polymerase [Verrucomicrobiales bacterium]
MFADLHLHTHFSDGTYSPEELAGHAHRLGFGTIALTDHDTVQGCARMAVACAALQMEFIPATELTAEIDGDEVHLLGMFLNPTHPRLLVETAKYQKVRTDRIYEMVSRLNKQGVPLKPEVVFKLANCQSPGRPHVARALVQEGICRNMDEAFDRFLKKHRVAWVPKFKVSAGDAIALIHEAGGLAILAHPGLNRNDSSIPKLIEEGLDGLECFHSKHGDAASQHYLSLAEKYHVLVTGGSDCHGMSKGKPLIGTIKLPYSYVVALKEKVASRGGSAVVA